ADLPADWVDRQAGSGEGVMTARPPASSAIVESLKEAVIAGVVTAVLTSLLVGFRTLDVGGALGLETRFGSVGWAAARVALGRFGLSLQRRGRPLLGLAGGLGIGVLVLLYLLEGDDTWIPDWLVPFDDPVVNGILGLFAGAIFLRSLLLWRFGPSQSVSAGRMRLDAQVLAATRWLGPLLIVFAIVMPMLPFA